jgi:C1A family cysteine protease
LLLFVPTAYRIDKKLQQQQKMKLQKLMLFGICISLFVIGNAQDKPSLPDNREQNRPAIVDGHGFGEIPVKKRFVFSKNIREKSALVLPGSYDLRIVDGGKYLSKVKDQGESQACWAFATYGAVESYWLKQVKGQLDFSEQHLATCHGFINSPDDGGNAYFSAAYFARLGGAVSEANNPFTLPENPECVGSIAPEGFITEARFLPGTEFVPNDIDLLSQTINGVPSFDSDLVKQSIIDNGALYVNMYMNKSFINPNDHTYFYCGANPPDHAVLLVGWDNNKEVTGNSIIKPQRKGAWICRNSYGDYWGEKGYFYISYEDTSVMST